MAAAQTPAPASETTVQAGLLNAEWNLDQAIALGMLPANDHADACMHAALTKIGIEPAQAGKPGAKSPASFTPRVTDLISGGAVLYIQGRTGQESVEAHDVCAAVVHADHRPVHARRRLGGEQWPTPRQRSDSEMT
jgi:hypothetical protein